MNVCVCVLKRVNVCIKVCVNDCVCEQQQDGSGCSKYISGA